ncbi:DUF2905 family protein [Bradyrhizobium manausense]|uniref:DUF2905 family protein n=1 Tax=Bradyrhizobium manausense TaxID=989370 RepID=UPI001FD8F584|nr:DUF2905 family protein [Bradyrhizobium manausense]
MWPHLSQIGLGRLPGDIVIERENMTLLFSPATCAARLHGAVAVIDGRQGHSVAMSRILHGRFTGSL